MQETSLVEARNLKKYFPVEKGLLGSKKSNRFVKAVDGVFLSIFKGETFGLVGESGCGKSTLARSILRLIEPDEGEVYFAGENILKLNKKSMRTMRRKMQIIFQNPFASLNPRMTVGTMLEEVLKVHNYPHEKIKDRIFELISLVGLDKNDIGKYPHEFSTGQRQRIGIARALAVGPEFIIADEPVSSLDVSIQAQIVNLLMDLQEKMFLTYLFISHDLALVRHVANRIAVMYMGQIVEIAQASELYIKPLHPYTQMLLSSLPRFYLEDIKCQVLTNDKWSTDDMNLSSGCCFYFRCSKRTSECIKKTPELKEVSREHFVRCIKRE